MTKLTIEQKRLLAKKLLEKRRLEKEAKSKDEPVKKETTYDDYTYDMFMYSMGKDPVEKTVYSTLSGSDSKSRKNKFRVASTLTLQGRRGAPSTGGPGGPAAGSGYGCNLRVVPRWLRHTRVPFQRFVYDQTSLRPRQAHAQKTQ